MLLETCLYSSCLWYFSRYPDPYARARDADRQGVQEVHQVYRDTRGLRVRRYGNHRADCGAQERHGDHRLHARPDD